MEKQKIFEKDYGVMVVDVAAMERQKMALLEAELREMPEGSLGVYFSDNSPGFYHIIHRKKHSIGRNMDMVYALARKVYLLQMTELEHEGFALLKKPETMDRAALAGLSKKRENIEKLLSKYAKAGLELMRITCTKEQFLWAKANYKSNPTPFPDGNEYYTNSGVRVRSKSEQSIGNLLESYGIPYRYEPATDVDIAWMEGINGARGGRYKTYYPDFVILTLDGSIIIWEHLGLAHKQGYRIHNMEKIAAYRQSGICDEAHLIFTFESDLKDMKTVEEIIQRRILPLM